MQTYKRYLTLWVLAAGIMGYVASTCFGSASMLELGNSHPVYGTVLLTKTAFIKMLFMLVAPVVFFSLIDGIIGIRDAVAMRRLGASTLAYYLGTTAIAVAIGLSIVLLWHPWTSQIERGAAITETTASDAGTEAGTAPVTISRSEPGKLIGDTSGAPANILKEILLRCFQNPFTALSDVNILAIVMHAILIGLAIVLAVPQDSPLVTVIQHINLIFHRILSWIILFAPLGVFAIVFDFRLQLEGDIMRPLLSFCFLVFGATMLHGLVFLPAIAWLLGGVSPVQLFRRIAQPLLVALSTASSAATLPITLKTCEEDLGVPTGVASFVCPLGATMNMDGTALFEGIAAVFLAWLYGIELGTGHVVAIFAMAMVSSIGAPGMPSGSMSGMQMVLLAAGIPLEAIGILLVVERPLDTFRTAVNVEGDIVGALVVSRHMARLNAA